MRKVLVVGAIAAFFVALYGVLGNLLAPSLIRSKLVEQAARAGFELRFGAIATHAFPLVLNAYDVQLSTREGGRILYANRATIDLAWSSLWRRAWIVQHVGLEKPVLYALPAAPRARSGSESTLPAVIVRELRVERGILALPDVPHLEHIALRAVDISTVAGHANAFSASAAMTGGGAAHTDGKLSLLPLQVEGELRITGAALAQAWRYLPSSMGEPPAGELSASAHYRYAAGKLALSKVDALAKSAGGATLQVRGEVALAPLAGRLQLEARKVPLDLAQPWLAAKTRVRIVSGGVDAHGTVRLGAKYGYDGAIAIHDARIDAAEGELFAWRSLAAADVRLDFAPFGARATELVATGARVNVVIGPHGELNIARAFAAGGARPARAERPAIAVDRLRIEEGRLDFADRSLATPFATTVENLAGALSGLSTAGEAPARVELAGRVGRYGEAHLRGLLEPVAPATRTNLQLRLRNLALADFTPYAVKFAGYRIRGGRLSAQLRYRVRDGRLVGSNDLEFHRLQLGEKVQSAGVLDLPIDLAVALLTDAEGRINLAIPVSGNLRDPQFDIGGLVAKALRNTLANVVSAPFRMLASLLGTGADADELKQLGFAPGSAALSPPQEEQLARIAQALAERPQLALTIRAGYDPQADLQALKRAALLRELAARAGYSAAAGASAPAAIDARDPKIRHAAERLYLARGGQAFDLARLKPREPGYAQRLLGALVEKTDVAADVLSALAERRAQAVREALTGAGVEAARIIVGPAAVAEAQEEGIGTTLSLRPA